MNTEVNCDGCEQSTAPRASHASSSNCRSAENRFCPGSALSFGRRVRSIALTWMRSNRWRPSSSTVTCLPATGEPSDAQFVASVSSISAPRVTPSPVAVAPFVLDARLSGMLTVKSRSWPARTVSVVRTWPKPLARATNS